MERRHPRDDERSDDELFATALDEVWLGAQYDQATDARRTLRWRGSRAIFERAAAMTRSAEARERCVGVDVVSALHDRSVPDDRAPSDSRPPHGFADEAERLVVPMADPGEDPDVLVSVAWAFGNNDGFGGRYEPLLPLAVHADEDVRLAVVQALPTCAAYVEHGAGPDELARALAYNEPIARALIGLADDPDGDVRDWAIFGLAGLELDGPEIRQLYVEHLDDDHADAREEAIYALAALQDERALEPLVSLLEDVDEESVPGHGALEAAEALADPRLLPALERLVGDEDVYQPALQRAISACRADGPPGALPR